MAQLARVSMSAHIAVLAVALVVAALVTAFVLADLVGQPWHAFAIAGALFAPLGWWIMRRRLAPASSMFRALAGTVTSYRDGDFAFSLVWPHRDELGELVAAHNALGDTLRAQRETLVHRELLLDTMVQNTPVAMLLVAAGAAGAGEGHIVYANLAARKLLGDGRRLEGQALAALLDAVPQLRDAVAGGGDGLFVVERDAEEDIYYLARTSFRLNGRAHELFVLRQLTAELHREEVRTWKKVIRVISHELNNSLAPVASLAHTGRELVRRGQHAQLDKVFETIEERARHLDQFIQGYARFAKLPAPRREPVAWSDMLDKLRSHFAFTLDGEPPSEPARVDPAQLEQALLNLLRNAHESGSAPGEVRVRVRSVERPRGVAIDVFDRGGGMTETVLANALLPFYSTKRGGTGLGLALVREIVEAHGGRVALTNRDGGGLHVTMTLPLG